MLSTARFISSFSLFPISFTLNLQLNVQSLHNHIRSMFRSLQNMPHYPLLCHQVPPLFCEPFIIRGFREIHRPWSYYLKSLLHKHNETINVWSHLSGILYMAYMIFDYRKRLNFFENAHSWPFAVALCTAIIMFMCSAFAHLFHSKSEKVHMTCFLIDFVGISVHGFGSGLLHIYYCAPQWYYEKIEYQYAVVLVTLSVLACFLNCFAQYYYTRPYPPMKRICQFFPCGLLWIYTIIPLCIRLYSSDMSSNPALIYHLAQMILFLIGAILFGFDLPQRFCPGLFDFIGQGHHLFHTCIYMIGICQMRGVFLDYEQFQAVIDQRSRPELMFCAGSMVFLIICDFFVVWLFRRRIHHRYHMD